MENYDMNKSMEYGDALIEFENDKFYRTDGRDDRKDIVGETGISTTMVELLDEVKNSKMLDLPSSDDLYTSDNIGQNDDQITEHIITDLEQGQSSCTHIIDESIKMTTHDIDDGSGPVGENKNTNVTKWGFASITGGGCFDWSPKVSKYDNDQRYYSKLTAKRNAVFVRHVWTPAYNVSLNTWTAATFASQAARTYNHVELLIASRLTTLARNAFTIRFLHPYTITANGSILLTKYMKNGSLDQRAIVFDLQMRCYFSRALAQIVAPVLMNSLPKCDVVSFYAIGYLALAQRCWYDVARQVPRMVDIANDAMERVNLNDAAVNMPFATASFKSATENGALVILAKHYTAEEIDALHYICNGMPVFRHALAAKYRSVLDDLDSPKIPTLVVYENAIPQYGDAILSATSIRSVLRKLAIYRNEYDAALGGFMRASSYAFMHDGVSGHASSLNGLLEYKYASWYQPRFQNPVLHWLNISTNVTTDNTISEYLLATGGTCVEILERMVDLNCLTAVGVATTFLRWNVHSGLLNAAPNVGDDGDSFRTFIYTKINGVNRHALILRMVRDLLTQMTGFGFQPEFLNMPQWCDSLESFDGAILTAEGWQGGWPRRIPFAASVYSVLWQVINWPSIWGFLKSPITITLNRVLLGDTSRMYATFYPMLGDDEVGKYDISRGAVPCTPYTSLLLNACLQHAKVQDLPAAEWMWSNTRMMSLVQPADNAVLPNLDYNVRLRVINPGSLWTYDWLANRILLCFWTMDRLNDQFRTLILNDEKQYLVSGIRSGIVADVMVASGKRPWNANLDDLEEED
ncbi:hypothetical protein GJ496_006217 [Pomphorhynchus laevis]|nr:hypothetical protein GJ496_006217 [Pomphorhynchus laevis]